MATKIKVTILYASETEEAQDYAENLCEIFMGAFDAKVVSMDEFDMVQLEQEPLVLVVTTTSDNGGPPGNGEKFHTALMEMYATQKSSSNKPKVNIDGTEPLANVRFSVFGLGSQDRSFARTIDTLFEDLGAERVFQKGEEDELCGQAESFRIWAKRAFKAACDDFCVAVDGKAKTSLINKDRGKKIKGNIFPLTYRFTSETPELTGALYNIHKKKVYGAKLLSRKKLECSDSNRSTFFLQIHTNNHKGLRYQAGDEFGIFPGNDEESVTFLIDKLEDAPPVHRRNSALGVVSSRSDERQLPPCTIYQAFKYFLDINTPPKPQFLQLLVPLTKNDEERNKLEVLSKGLEEYEEWKRYNNPTMVEIMEEFPSLEISGKFMLTQLPLLKPRFYCICSSPDTHPGEIHVAVGVITYLTRDGSGPIHSGVCTSWLATVETDATVPCFIRGAPTFRITKDPKLPCILVGQGKHIAAYRAFWEQRQYDFQYKGIEFCPMILVLGCQNSRIDHIYKEGAIQAKKDGVLGELYMSYTDEPEKPKKYEQDVLREQLSDTLYSCLNDRGGHIYVSGNKIMCRKVLQTIQQIIELKGNMSLEDAVSFVSKLREEGLYHERVLP